jgi:uncharacterized membrane protein
MLMLETAAAVFVGIHLLIAGTRARDAITRAVGEQAYLVAFSLASIGAIIWLATSYNAVQPPGAGNPVLYTPGRGVHDMGIVVILIAFWLGVQGLFSSNPTSVRQEASAAKDATVHGVLRITRHPFLWGVILWSAFHIAANGDLASVILFGAFLLLALFGTFSIDAKRKRMMGAEWAAFAGKTSNVPFAAVLGGRTKLNLGESFGWRFWVALILFVAILFAHARIFGVSPFPGGYVPF